LIGSSLKTEKTLLFLKPDGVMRGLIGEIISRIERKCLIIAAIKLIWLTKQEAQKFYAVHKGKPFFEALVNHVTSGPILAMVIQGPDAVNVVRRLIGKTNPIEASPGTIRGDFGLDLTKNLVHASDSRENAEREIAFFFQPQEILEYQKPTEVEFAF
jgi:nucleoside-diphosphate kinase